MLAELFREMLAERRIITSPDRLNIARIKPGRAAVRPLRLRPARTAVIVAALAIRNRMDTTPDQVASGKYMSVIKSSGAAVIGELR